MKCLIYKVTSDAHRGLKREFTNKREAKGYARLLRGDGWTATVYDMRSDAVIDSKPKAGGAR